MAILDAERSKTLYNGEEYADNTNNWEDDVSSFRATALITALSEAKLIGRISSILDVGCGSGGVLAKVSQDPRTKGVELHGIDISVKAIEIAERIYCSDGDDRRVTFEVRSITDLPAERKYSVLSLIHVLEHCPDMLEMLEECAVRSDFQYINVPLEFNIFYALRGSIPAHQYEKYGHLHFFDERFFIAWLERNGFEVITKVYSEDYMIHKSGVMYNLIKSARRASQKIFGPLATIKFLAGLSGGYLVRKR